MSRNVGRHYAGNVGRYAGRNVRHYAGGYDAGRNVGRYARNYDYWLSWPLLPRPRTLGKRGLGGHWSSCGRGRSEK